MEKSKMAKSYSPDIRTDAVSMALARQRSTYRDRKC